MKPATLMINEIFYSIQGESTWAGLPCVFIRLMGCDLRCRYCDTEYAFYEGNRMNVTDVIDAAEEKSGGNCSLYEITGGEPLLQPNVHQLMARLCDAGRTVLIETSGAHDISVCDPRVIRIMDIKTPDSGEANRNRWENIIHLNKRDEVKFVLCSETDYQWARQVITKYELADRVHAVLMSAAAAMKPGLEIAGTPGLSLRDLSQWVLADQLPVRVQTQLHKLIWDPSARGV